MAAPSAAGGVMRGLSKKLAMHILVTLIAAAALTDALPQSLSAAGPHRALTQSAVVIPDAAASGCPSSVPPPPQEYLNNLREHCRVGNSSGETCARCSCVLMGAQLTADDDKADAAMRAYLQQLDLVDSDSAPACTTLAFKKAGVSEGVIEALASEPCSWEVARRQPVCGTIMAQVTGCPVMHPDDLAAMKANCSAADAASAKAACQNCACSFFNSAFKAGLRGSAEVFGKCLQVQAAPTFSKAMLDAILEPGCEVPSDNELAMKCPSLDPTTIALLAKTGTGAQTGAGAKSGAGSAARVSVGALGATLMLVLMLVLL